MRIRVVLVEPERQGNVGGIARAMKNFGLSELYIVNPKEGIGDEARAYASHAVDVLESSVIVDSLEEALKGVNYVVGTTAKPAKSPSNLRRIAIFPEELARKLASAPEGVTAILFGRESVGLLNRELDLCDVVVTIPASPQYPVLNVVTAAAIIFYEIYKATRCEGGRVSYARPADRMVVEAALRHFRGLMEAIGLKGSRLELTVSALKNVMGRSFISSREASLLAGGFRKALVRVATFKEERGELLKEPNPPREVGGGLEA